MLASSHGGHFLPSSCYHHKLLLASPLFSGHNIRLKYFDKFRGDLGVKILHQVVPPCRYKQWPPYSYLGAWEKTHRPTGRTKLNEGLAGKEVARSSSRDTWSTRAQQVETSLVALWGNLGRLNLSRSASTYYYNSQLNSVCLRAQFHFWKQRGKGSHRHF